MKSVRPKKFLGQHFLTHLPTAQAIADTVDACPGLPVLEVGPGMGVMTQFLLQKDRPLKVVEIDFESVSYLRREYPQLEEQIIEDDFLKMHLERTFGGQPFVLTGNDPYNISSQIFFKMLDYRDLIPCCTGMIQKEVAERLAAQPGCKAYGILTVLVQLYYHVDYLFTSGTTGWNDLEVDGQLQGRLLNDRLLINGNLGYRDRPTSTSNFVGDFDIRYLLTPKGGVSLRAYSETTDRYFTRSSLTTQGVGLSLQRDFTRFWQLFRRERKKRGK